MPKSWKNWRKEVAGLGAGQKGLEIVASHHIYSTDAYESQGDRP